MQQNNWMHIEKLLIWLMSYLTGFVSTSKGQKPRLGHKLGGCQGFDLDPCKVKQGWDFDQLFQIQSSWFLLLLLLVVVGGWGGITGSRCSTKSNLAWWELLTSNTEHLASVSTYGAAPDDSSRNPFKWAGDGAKLGYLVRRQYVHFPSSSYREVFFSGGERKTNLAVRWLDGHTSKHTHTQRAGSGLVYLAFFLSQYIIWHSWGIKKRHFILSELSKKSC